MTHPITTILKRPDTYARYICRTPLRPYQAAIANEIARALHDHGQTVVVQMPRQSGKNQITATLEAWLLTRYQRTTASLVKCAPAARPQLVTSMDRVMTLLDNPLTRNTAKTRLGYIVQVGTATAYYLSAAPAANVVGATASLALLADEAQEIDVETYQRKFEPMTASTNATQIFTGTAWTTDSLLAQKAALGGPYTYRLKWSDIANDLPEYGAFVQNQIARLGPDHPIIQTQYETNPIDPRSTPLFTDADITAMHGDHPRQQRPNPQPDTYLLIDAGATFTDNDPDHRTDKTAWTVATQTATPNALPTYTILDRGACTANPAQLAQLADAWQATIVIDATGPGSALANALISLYPRTQPVTITSTLKTTIGWTLLAIVKTGRYHDYAPDNDPTTAAFWSQVRAATRTIDGNTLKWSVTDRQLHDDLLMSAALCATLDTASPTATESYIIESETP